MWRIAVENYGIPFGVFAESGLQSQCNEAGTPATGEAISYWSSWWALAF